MLSGETIPEERYFLLGFVSSKVLNLASDAWFLLLSPGQIAVVDKYIEKDNYS
jgi:hypothetical protein